MNTVYEHSDTNTRGYYGVSLAKEICRTHLSDLVKDNLLDREEREVFSDKLRTLEADTGFTTSERLLADIQALDDEHVDVQNFRIGEAYAEVVLEESFQCRFHWNELRDARNPKGNKTGADLVGFIEVDEQVLFLFGEVKTSSETTNRPPQVMTNADGMENQLRDLYASDEKKRILIAYLQNKARLFPEGHPFKEDLNAGIKAYYLADGSYQLIGVLVRDVEPDENDISISYGRIKDDILEPIGLKLLALYLPIKKAEWLQIINQRAE
jgi:hypothetical protein